LQEWDQCTKWNECYFMAKSFLPNVANYWSNISTTLTGVAEILYQRILRNFECFVGETTMHPVQSEVCYTCFSLRDIHKWNVS